MSAIIIEEEEHDGETKWVARTDSGKYIAEGMTQLGAVSELLNELVHEYLAEKDQKDG